MADVPIESEGKAAGGIVLRRERIDTPVKKICSTRCEDYFGVRRQIGSSESFFYGRVKAIWRYTYVWTSMPVTYFEVTFHLLSLICPVTVSKVSRVTKI